MIMRVVFRSSREFDPSIEVGLVMCAGYGASVDLTTGDARDANYVLTKLQ